MSTTKKSDGAGTALTTSDQRQMVAIDAAEAVKEIVHQEPQKGGSYTRDLESGDLIPNAPAPANNPKQE